MRGFSRFTSRRGGGVFPCPYGIASIRPCHGLEQKARVGDRSGHGADVGVGAEQIRRLQMWDRAERRLEADDPATGGGNAD